MQAHENHKTGNAAIDGKELAAKRSNVHACLSIDVCEALRASTRRVEEHERVYALPFSSESATGPNESSLCELKSVCEPPSYLPG